MLDRVRALTPSKGLFSNGTRPLSDPLERLFDLAYKVGEEMCLKSVESFSCSLDLVNSSTLRSGRTTSDHRCSRYGVTQTA